MSMKPDIDVRDATVVAYFPAGIDAAYLTPTEARAWADALTRAAAAADLIRGAGASEVTSARNDWAT